MTLTAYDVASLSKSLSCWEIGEYICAGFVTIACAGEYVAEFTNWFTDGIKERKERLTKLSTLVLIVALSLELICLVRTNILSGTLIGSLSEKAEEADSRARTALSNSATATSSAQEAVHAAGEAQGKADVIATRADDLLRKYVAAERDLLALKAKSLPRRLSSEQKELLRKRVAMFGTKSIFIACVSGGIETWDFEQDFVSAFNNPALHFKVEYALSCSVTVGPVTGTEYRTPVQVEAGAERQGDADILIKALIDIGINKKDIVTETNTNKLLLALTIGPKPP